jgi:hypothetical protein
MFPGLSLQELGRTVWEKQGGADERVLDITIYIECPKSRVTKNILV